VGELSKEQTSLTSEGDQAGAAERLAEPLFVLGNGQAAGKDVHALHVIAANVNKAVLDIALEVEEGTFEVARGEAGGLSALVLIPPGIHGDLAADRVNGEDAGDDPNLNLACVFARGAAVGAAGCFHLRFGDHGAALVHVVERDEAAGVAYLGIALE